MIRKIDVGSVFGNAQRTSYEYMNLLSKTKKDNFKTLVIDDKDGLTSLLILFSSLKSTFNKFILI